MSKDKLEGGKADKMSIEDIAKSEAIGKISKEGKMSKENVRLIILKGIERLKSNSNSKRMKEYL